MRKSTQREKIDIPFYGENTPEEVLDISRGYVISRLRKLVGKKVRLEMDIRFYPTYHFNRISTTSYWVMDSDFARGLYDEMAGQLIYDIDETVEGTYRSLMSDSNVYGYNGNFDLKVTGFRVTYK